VRSTPDNKALLLNEQVHMLFNAVPNSLVANLAGAVLALLMYTTVVGPSRLYLWIAMMLTVTCCRYLHYRRFIAVNPGLEQIPRWYSQFRIGSLILAGVAGSAGFLLFVYDNIVYQLVLALMMVCIASFAITTMSPSRELATAFLLLLLSPLSGSLLLSHALTNLPAMWMMPLATAMLIISSLRISYTLRRNMQLTIDAREREKALQNYQQRLGLYVQQLPLAVLELTPDSTIVQWNPGAEQLFGYAKAEAEGHPLNSLLASSRSRERMDTLWSGLSGGGKSSQFIVENRCKSGALVQCEWIVTPLVDTDGNSIGLIALIQNITERLENDRIKQEFVSIVSHELRTPVTAIKGSLALLTSGILDDDNAKRNELKTLALENTNRLHLLINDILDVEKLESGRMDYHFTSGDLRALVLQVLSANEPVAQQAGIKLQCKLPESRYMAMIDPDRIFQVLTNILANAIKFSRPDSTVTLSLDGGEGLARLGVHNYGEVIPDSDRAKLFTKFFQRDSTATRAKGGTGLGLYICQKILAEHHSKLDFTSSEAEGTCFFFYLALAG